MPAGSHARRHFLKPDCFSLVPSVTNDRTEKITIGEWEISRATCTLSRNGTDVRITPRSMDVLSHLAEHAGLVISPDELLDRFWKNTVPSDHAVHKAVAELRSALGDNAHDPSYIKTFPKRGYAMIAHVAAVAPELGLGTASGSDLPRPAGRSVLRGVPAGIAACLLAFVFLAAIFYRTPTSTEASSEVARLAVLPFVNREIDTDNRFLADGLRESLINGLSKLSNLQVVVGDEEAGAGRVRRSADEAPGPVADHLLQGSVQTADGRLRVTVQLVRAQDGVHQYSDQFDLPLNNLFGVQDEIVSNVVRALSVHLDERERSQMLDWGTTDAIAYENFLRGEFYNNQFNPRDWQRAIDHHLRAVELDPQFLNAWHGAATAANNLAVYSGAARIEELRQLVSSIHDSVASRVEPQSAVLASLREIKLRMSGNNQVQQEMLLREQILSGSPPDFAMAHYALFLIGARLYEEAERMLERASEVGPFQISPDEVWSYRNSIEPPAEIVVSRKIQLSQRPYHVAFLGTVASNLAWLGEFDEAERFLERQREVDQEQILLHLSEVTIGFLSGRLSPGSPALKEAYRSGEDFYYNNGSLAFMLGDVDTGIHYWSKLRAVQLRRLFNVANSSEKYFAAHVLSDPRYHQLLEELGAGKSWQRRLMEGVMEMEAVTGVGLSDASRQAYENDAFMMRNNLWPEQVWAEIDARRLNHIHR